MRKKIYIGLALLLYFILIIGQNGMCTDTEQTVSVKIEYKYDETAISGAEFSIYRVAEITADSEYSLTGEFENYKVSLNELDSQDWRSIAITLSGYVTRDKITPEDSGITDANGAVDFPNDTNTLKTGLYLVIGEKRVLGNYTYTCEPFMISLPGSDADGNYEYDITAYPKAERKSNPSYTPGRTHTSSKTPVPASAAPNTPDTDIPQNGTDTPDNLDFPKESNTPNSTDNPPTLPKESNTPNDTDTPGGSDEDIIAIKVLKLWKNDDEKRPENIEIQLLCDDEIYDTVKLNSQNNWNYTWYDLDKSYTWQIVEKAVPDGYTVLVDKLENTYIVTNTYQLTDKTPSGSSKPKPAATPGNGGKVPPEKLPQTGQLQWPVPILAFLGLMLFVFGWIRHRNAGAENEK